MKCNFNIGDIVCSKKTGLPTTGKVVIIQCPIYHLINTRSNDVPYWTELYSDWKEKPVIVIKFNKPQRNVSFEEYMRFNDKVELHIAKEAYESIPPAVYAAYPYEDLEIFEPSLV